MAERLQRYLARAGVASRRHAEELITAGRVTVNNQPTTTLGTKVEPNDLVALDGKLVMPPENVSWYVLYKPAGVVTTLDDPQGRPTVLGLLGAIPTRVFPIGRLDWDAEGALLLTDDGAAAHRLLHPSFQVPRTYLAKVKGVPTDESLARLVAGVRLEDGQARALEVERFQAVERNTWLRVTVGEGRPHLVKRLCAAIGHPVVRLFRPHQAGISVAGMQPGELRALRPEELALISAVAGGQPVPPMTLSLPARRHGRADEESSDGAEDAGERPPKPPRFGTRPWRNAAAEASTRRGQPPEAGSQAGGHARRSAGLRPPGAGFPPEGRRPGSSPPRRQGEGGGNPGGPAAGRGRWGGRGGTSPRAGAGLERGRPSRGVEGASNHPRDVRGGAGAPHGAASPRRPHGARPGFEGTRPSLRGGGRDFRAKPADSRGWTGAERGPPGARPGSSGRGPPARGGGFERRDGGGADFRGTPADSRGPWSGAKRRPTGARPGFGGKRPTARGEGVGRPDGGGRHFPAKPAPRAGGWSGARDAPAGPQREGRGGAARGPPTAGAWKGGSGVRRGPPGDRPRGGKGWGGAPGAEQRPRSGSAPRASSGGRAHGRPPEGRRGPPRPRGGAPRGPRR